MERKHYHKLNTATGNILTSSQIAAVTKYIDSLPKKEDPKYIVYLKNDIITSAPTDEHDLLRVSVIRAIDDQLYAMYQLLGAGSQGKVKLMQCLKENSDGEYDWVPVKITALTEHSYISQKNNPLRQDMLKDEKDLLQKFNYWQNYQERTSTTSKPHKIRAENKKTYTVMCYIPGIDCLESLIDTKTQALHFMSYQEKILMCILMGRELQRTHDFGYIHRDVKLENFMLDRAVFDVKIIDFGTAKNKDNRRQLGLIGTIENAAPEAKRNYETNVLTDAFSLGMTFYAIFFSHDKDDYALLEQHISIKESMYKLITQMIKKNPRERLSIPLALPKLYALFIELYKVTDIKEKSHLYLMTNYVIDFSLEQLRITLNSYDKTSIELIALKSMLHNLTSQSPIMILSNFIASSSEFVTEFTRLNSDNELILILTNFSTQFSSFLEKKRLLEEEITSKLFSMPKPSSVTPKITVSLTVSQNILNALAHNFSHTVTSLENLRKKHLKAKSILFTLKSTREKKNKIINELKQLLSKLSNTILTSNFTLSQEAYENFQLCFSVLIRDNPQLRANKSATGTIMHTFCLELEKIIKSYYDEHTFLQKQKKQ